MSIDSPNGAVAPGSFSHTRLLNRPLLITVLVMVALAALLVSSYFMIWSHFAPGPGESWSPSDVSDAQPIILWSNVSQSPPNFAAVAVLVLLGPPIVYVAFGLLGLFAWRKRMIAGVVTLLIGIWCAITTSLILMASSICDCASPRQLDLGGCFGILAALSMPIAAIVLINQKGKLFALIPRSN